MKSRVFTAVIVVVLCLVLPHGAHGVDELTAQLERLDGEDYEVVLEALQGRAEAGDTDARYWLGRLLHDFAPLTRRDFERGREWLDRAAEDGHVDAAEMLGRVYEIGFIVPTDIDEARRYYALAADLGSVSGPHDLARLGFNREPRDDEEILRLLTLAAERGHRNAIIDLGFMHASGALGEVDGNNARRWAERGVEMRDPRAMNLMARLYATGLGTGEPDGVEALKWAILARDLGNEEAADLAREISEQLPEDMVQQARDRARAWRDTDD